jgi:hypothetical protein
MILVAGERMELAAFYVATSTAATGTVSTSRMSSSTKPER